MTNPHTSRTVSEYVAELARAAALATNEDHNTDIVNKNAILNALTEHQRALVNELEAVRNASTMGPNSKQNGGCDGTPSPADDHKSEGDTSEDTNCARYNRKSKKGTKPKNSKKSM